MSKKQGVKIAVLGGRQFTAQQYTGTVGGQSTSFAAIDSEIKSTQLKSSSLAPPDFIGNAYQGLTWRLGFSVEDGVDPEEWENHEADDNFPLTLATWVIHLLIYPIFFASPFINEWLTSSSFSVNRPEAIWKDLAARWWPGLQ